MPPRWNHAAVAIIALTSPITSLAAGVTTQPLMQPATQPTSQPATQPVHRWTVQAKTADFYTAADLILKQLLTTRFSGTTGPGNSITVTPAERAILDKLKTDAQALQARPHDMKIALHMMQDLNEAVFLAQFDTSRPVGAAAVKSNERPVLTFLQDLRDHAASLSPLMAVINALASANQLLTQPQINADGTINTIAGSAKPTPWLDHDNTADKRWIDHLQSIRTTALDALAMEWKDDQPADLPQTSDNVKTSDGLPLRGPLRLTKGKIKGITIIEAAYADSPRTTGTVDEAHLHLLSAALGDPQMPTTRGRYVQPINADKRLLDEALSNKPKPLPLTPETLTFEAVK